MGFFDHIQKKGQTALKPQTSQIRRETISAAPDPRKRFIPTPQRLNSDDSRPSKGLKRNGPTSTSLKARRQDLRKRISPVQQHFDTSSDDSGTDVSLGASRKRIKTSTETEPDLKRQFRCPNAFLENEDASFPMVHAADFASVDKSGKFVAAFEGLTGCTAIELQYPSASHKERYVVPNHPSRAAIALTACRFQLVTPRENDDFRPLEDIREVIESVATNYLPPEECEQFMGDSTGYPRRLKRAIQRQSEKDFREVIQEWNNALTKLRRDGTIGRILDSLHSLDLPLIERILTQTYSRTVSPRVGTLRQYENGTDNVYGELLPRFISKIFKDTRMKSDQIFVDLGSGVGNVVLQAALEIGCESWGCEMMDNACDLAELQEKEFKARCRLWGLAAGDIHLERGDFLRSGAIGSMLQRADVVLVNNQAFTPQLNNGLINLFLDLKEGCQIVSLKSFVPHGHKITSRNLNSPVNLLEVETKRYWSGSVSWTDAAGTYFVARKDSSKLRSFVDRNSM